MMEPLVLMLPFPLQGHIKPMLDLAKLLCTANFQVMFINSDYNQDRLQKVTDMSHFSTHFPGLRFESISDGLPPEHPRVAPSDADLFFSTRSVTKPLFKQLLISIIQNSSQTPPISCIIADGFMSFANDIAEELNIPVLCFHTQSAYSLCAYFHVANLIKQGVIPFPGEKDLDELTSIPGLEDLFRFRDLPNICRYGDVSDPVLQFFITEVLATVRSSGLIVNTFDDLESPAISELGSLFQKIYSIGPLYSLLKSRIQGPNPIPSSVSNGNLTKEDRSCMTWLDSQPLRSVVYVSFGSLVGLNCDKVLEFWHGLVNSSKPFLWAIRRDLVLGEVGQIPEELQNGTKERGFMVDWAPQDEVLAHPAIGGFLTHSGWNSTLESIVSKVPMICWPVYADQQVNSRCVSHVWKIGFDMKDVCDRKTIEEMVKILIDGKRTEIMRLSLEELARMAHDSVQKGGSSYSDFEMLIENIRSMSLDCGSSN